ncbi:MAG TPA: ABC transporter substrate-binding protein, partial [bacterium]|nr:ABC transporter substrate-binding protein [bacterium]
MKKTALWGQLIFLLFLGRAALAAPGPVDFARGALRDLSLARKEAIQLRVERYYDFSALFDRATQDFQAKLSPEESARLRRLFVEAVTRGLAGQADRWNGKRLSRAEFSLERQEGRESVVAIRGLVDRRPVRIEWTLAPSGASFKIVDLAVQGALLSRNYRGPFNRIFRVEGFSGLERRMKRNVE